VTGSLKAPMTWQVKGLKQHVAAFLSACKQAAGGRDEAGSARETFLRRIVIGPIGEMEGRELRPPHQGAAGPCVLSLRGARVVGVAISGRAKAGEPNWKSENRGSL
jgi:hypothetical protein